MRLAYNDSMSPVEKFRYDRNLPNAASRHALDFTNLGACRWREERVKQQSKTPIRTVKALAPIGATIGYTNSVVKSEWQIFPYMRLRSRKDPPSPCSRADRAPGNAPKRYANVFQPPALRGAENRAYPNKPTRGGSEYPRHPRHAISTARSRSPGSCRYDAGACSAGREC
jgi:hypothetical protein